MYINTISYIFFPDEFHSDKKNKATAEYHMKNI